MNIAEIAGWVNSCSVSLDLAALALVVALQGWEWCGGVRKHFNGV